MFPKWIINDTQILLTVLSSTWEKELWSWGVTSASLALLMTWAPFEGPVSGIKIIMNNDGSFISDPSTLEEKEAKLNLVVAWTLDAITMVEAWANEVSDSEILAGLEFAHNIIKDICNAQLDYISSYKKEFGIAELEASFNNPDISLYEKAREFLTEEKLECLYDKWKKEFQKELDKLDIELKELFLEKDILKEEDDSSFIGALVYKRVKEVMRKNILEKDRRLDWRKTDEVRQIWGETGLLPRTHWSALIFKRYDSSIICCYTRLTRW